MSFTIEWTSPALRDLDELCDWIAADNPSAAERLASQIEHRMEQLAVVPRTGGPFLHLGSIEIRQVVVRPYRIFYQILSDRQIIRVLRVWHGSRREPSTDDLTGKR